MNNFLHGFANELVKLGAASSSAGTNYVRDTNRNPGANAPAPAAKPPAAPKPASGATPRAVSGGARVPKFGVPVGGYADKKKNPQAMNWTSGPAKPTRYREPDSGPNMAPVTTKTEKPKTGGGGKRGKRGKKSDGAVLNPRRRLPGERIDDMQARLARTGTESKAWKKRKAMGSLYNTAYGRQGESKELRPDQKTTLRGQGWNAPESTFNNATGKVIGEKNIQTKKMRQAATTMSKLRPG